VIPFPLQSAAIDFSPLSASYKRAIICSHMTGLALAVWRELPCCSRVQSCTGAARTPRAWVRADALLLGSGAGRSPYAFADLRQTVPDRQNFHALFTSKHTKGGPGAVVNGAPLLTTLLPRLGGHRGRVTGSGACSQNAPGSHVPCAGVLGGAAGGEARTGPTYSYVVVPAAP
jgi:hypothetical protein